MTAQPPEDLPNPDPFAGPLPPLPPMRDAETHPAPPPSPAKGSDDDESTEETEPVPPQPTATPPSFIPGPRGSHRRTTSRRPKLRWFAAVGVVVVIGVGITANQLGLLGSAQLPVAITVSDPPSTTFADTAQPPLPEYVVTIIVSGDASVTPGIAMGIVLPDGLHVVTNHHVVDGARLITVTSNGAEANATLVGSDVLTDVAVIRVVDGQLPPGDTPADTGVIVGQLVTTLSGADSTGTVLAADARLDVTDSWRLHNLIEIDLPISPQSSGSPLFNEAYEVIGLLTSFGISNDHGYAIPIADVLAVADDLMSNGSIAHAYLGIQGRNASPVGIEILALPANSAIRDAGGREGDIIVGLDNNEVESISDLITLLRTYREGDNVTASVIRGFETIALDVTLDRHPDS